ncbi:MAG: hypothetical protein ACRDV4_07510 [Acidimicrobiales bacterium]
MGESRAGDARRVLNVGGCTVLVEARGRRWAEAVAGLERDWRGQCEGPFAGRILCGSDPGPPPSRRPEFTDGPIQVWSVGDSPHIELENARLAMSEDGSVVIDGDPKQAEAALDRALPLALGWVLGRAESWVVHASAFVTDRAAVADGPGAVLVFGDTGAGKSTTAASALNAGWPVLSDDLVAVRWRERPEATGIPRTVWVPAELGTLRGAGRTIGTDGRRRRAVRPELAKGWFSVRAVVLVGHGTDPQTRVERIGSVEALRALWSAHFPALIPSRLARWFPLAARLARLPAWRLNLGTDYSARLATTADALSVVTATGTSPLPL